MFQTPQRRAGGGIMAGVAPINMQDGGDPDDTWLGVGKGIAGSLYDVGTDVVENINMPSPGELGISYDDDGVGLDLDELGDFANEQITASEDGFLGVFDGKPITMRDATDFFLVDPEDSTDVALATASAALLAFPPAAAAATLARYGWKGKKMFEKWAEYQKRFAPSKGTGNLATNFIKRRVFPTQESIASGLGNPLRPGQRYASFEMNRFLANEAGDLLIPSAKAEELPLTVEDPAGIAALENERVALDPMIEEAEAEGGIANVAKTIAEARSDKFKSPTFRRGDEDLAAVTKEDLIDAGYEGPGALTDYLNDMKFDDELGRYIEEIEAEGKANGGIMRLNGGGKVGLARGAWDWIKSIRRKKPDDRTQKEIYSPKTQSELASGNPESVSGSVPSVINRGGKQNTGKTVEGGGATKDGTIEGGGATKGSGWLGKTLTTGVVLGAGYGFYKLAADNAEEELDTAVAAGASATEIAELKALLAKAQEDLAKALEGNTTDDGPPPDEGNPLKQLFSKARQSLTFDDPQKALYIAGQMMKPTKGIVPVNAFTAGTEAAMEFDKNQSEMARNQATIDQVGTDLEREFFTLRSSAADQLGRELTASEANELLLHVRDDMQSKKALMTLFSTTAPDLINKDTVNQLSLSKAANYIKRLKP